MRKRDTSITKSIKGRTAAGGNVQQRGWQAGERHGAEIFPSLSLASLPNDRQRLLDFSLTTRGETIRPAASIALKLAIRRSFSRSASCCLIIASLSANHAARSCRNVSRWRTKLTTTAATKV